MRDITTSLIMMQGTTHRLSATLTEVGVIRILLEQAMLVFEARGALVRLLSPDGQELILGGAMGLRDAYLNKGPVWLSDSGVDRHVIAGEAIERAELHALLREQYEDLKLDLAQWHRFLALG